MIRQSALVKSGPELREQLNLADLPAGVYLLQVALDGRVIHQRFVKE